MSRRHLLFTLGLASCLATAPLTAQQAGPKLSVPYQTFTLPNGLTVILHEDHSVPVVSVNVWYRAGSANEKPGRTLRGPCGDECIGANVWMTVVMSLSTSLQLYPNREGKTGASMIAFGGRGRAISSLPPSTIM